LNPSRLTRKSLVKELEKQDIRFDNKENKDQLINLLETQLAEDTKKPKIAHNQINSTYNEENHHIFDGTGKRISPEIRALLEEYFLAGNINKSDRYTAQDMHNKLVQHHLK
ncbi:22722_t:CDS:2, partial [Gigaspora margarita]